MADNLLTVIEAGVRLNLKRDAVYNRIRDGLIDVVNVGSARRPQWRIEEAALARYIKARQRKGRRAA